MSASLEEDLVLETVEQMVQRRGSSLNKGAVIHSDQGAHYRDCCRQGLAKLPPWEGFPRSSAQRSLQSDQLAAASALRLFLRQERTYAASDQGERGEPAEQPFKCMEGRTGDGCLRAAAVPPQTGTADCPQDCGCRREQHAQGDRQIRVRDRQALLPFGGGLPHHIQHDGFPLFLRLLPRFYGRASAAASDTE